MGGVLRAARIMGEQEKAHGGATWRALDRRMILNRVMLHAAKALEGIDDGEDHLGHMVCRALMAADVLEEDGARTEGKQGVDIPDITYVAHPLRGDATHSETYYRQQASQFALAIATGIFPESVVFCPHEAFSFLTEGARTRPRIMGHCLAMVRISTRIVVCSPYPWSEGVKMEAREAMRHGLVVLRLRTPHIMPEEMTYGLLKSKVSP